MKDTTSNLGFLYGHMKEPSPLNEGDNVVIGSYVGIEGSTGHSTGEHVHVSCQDMTNKNHWTFGLPISQLINPTIYMGFPNQLHARIYYVGTPLPPPPQPIPSTNHKNWKWQKMKKFRIIT